MIQLGNRALKAGYWGVSFAEELENCNTDVFLAIGAMSQECDGLGFMTNVVNQFSRHPVALAVAALASCEAASGRFILGVGSGSPSTLSALEISDKMGLARLAEVVHIVRSLSDQDESNYSGKFFKFNKVHSLRAGKYHFPIFIPAIRDRAIEFAARHGDGIALSNFSSVEYLKHARSVIRSVSNKEDFQMACSITYIPTTDVKEGLKVATPFAQRYLSFPIIGETLLEKSGLDPQIASEIRKGRLERVTSDIVETMVVVGKPDKLFERIHAFEKLGVSVPIIGTDPSYLDQLLSVKLDLS